MSSSSEHHSVPKVVANDPEALRGDIEKTREDLGETVEALAYKLDVPARTRERADEAKVSLSASASSARDTVAPVIAEHREQLGRAGAVAAVLLLLLWRRRRKARGGAREKASNG